MNNKKLYVMLGVEHQDKNGDNGIYHFDYTSEINDAFSLNGIMDKDIRKPRSTLTDFVVPGEEEKKIQNPRVFKKIFKKIKSEEEEQLYVMTKYGFWKVGVKSDGKIGVLSGSPVDKIEIFKDLEKTVLTSFIGDGSLLGASIAYTSREELFISLLSGDKLKEEVNPGYLFYSAKGDLDNLTLIPDIKPTGTVFTKDDFVYVICGKELKVLHKKNNNYVYEGKNVVMNRNILSACALDDIILCADNEGGYVLSYKGYEASFQKGEKFNELMDNKQKLYLVSEAASVALIKTKNNELSSDKEQKAGSGSTMDGEPSTDKYYALFGMDEGKMRIYEVLFDQGVPCMRHFKTLSFSSLTKQVYVREGERHIQNLTVLSTNYIQFSLHNLYLRMGINALLNLDEKKVIPWEDEKEVFEAENKGEYPSKIGLEEYINSLKINYSFDKVFYTPHRIVSIELLKC